jgi:hypothetical protein
MPSTVTVWINAFIPKDVPGYTQVITKGANIWKTAVPLPTLARLNPLNLFKDWSAGYLTDQRTFNTDPASSVRMQSLAVVQLSPAATVTTVSHTSTGTTQVNMDSGDSTGFRKADMTRCTWGTLLTQATVKVFSPFPTPQFPRAPFTPIPSAPSTPGVRTLTIKGAANDPLVSASADIDYVGTFTFKLDASGGLAVEFDGEIDAFPAFECYAQCDNTTKTLFTAPPPSRNTVVNLLGSANRPMKGSVSFP